jgi:hypothetical protein
MSTSLLLYQFKVKKKCFQVTQEVAQILETKGYKLTCRGTIRVKGKGDMVTYFLEERPEITNNVHNSVHVADGKPTLL